MRSLLLLVALVATARADAHQQRAFSIFKELVEIDTTQSTGDTYKAAKAMGARLVAAGFPAADVKVFKTAAKRGNLVARYRGTGKQKPILLVAHLDVVEAKRADWSTDPFKLVEKDGYFYGRGTSDDKAWRRVRRELHPLKEGGLPPDRDLVLALDADEETRDAHYGIRWLLANHGR